MRRIITSCAFVYDKRIKGVRISSSNIVQVIVQNHHRLVTECCQYGLNKIKKHGVPCNNCCVFLRQPTVCAMRKGEKVFLKNNCACNRLDLYDEEFVNYSKSVQQRGLQGPVGSTGATGVTGATGATPEIRQNGNWWIGGVDTGVRAEALDGADGNDGVTPMIGENGNWFYRDVDSGQPARGEQGMQGETGPAGPEKIKAGYFVTLNDPDNMVPVNGLEIASGGRLPIKRLEVDNAELYVLDPTDNTIQFNQTGTYELIFSICAYVQKTGTDFDAATDFVSVGFRAVDSDIIFVGANNWSFNEVATNMVGVGVFEVTSIAEPFELINLQQKPMFLNGGKIEQVTTDSYFSCPLVSLTIKKLS